MTEIDLIYGGKKQKQLRRKIVGLYKQGVSIRDISMLTHTPQYTIVDVVKEYKRRTK